MWTKLKRQFWHWRGVIIIAPCITALVLGLRWAGWLQALELTALDITLFIRPTLPKDDRIVIVTINESDIAKSGQWPMNDAQLAQLLQKLKQQQPRVIGLDLYRDLPIEPGHTELVKIFESTPNLIGIRKVIRSGEGEPVKPPTVLAARGQIAANDFVLDGDGKLRRHLLSIVDPKNPENFVSSLGAVMAEQYLAAAGIKPESVPGSDANKLGKMIFRNLQPFDGGYVNADTKGYQILAHFQGLQRGFQTVSMSDVLEGRMPNNFVHERIVLIGTIAESTQDFFYTPYQSWWWQREQDRVPGIMLHADLASQLLSAAIDGQPLIRSWAEWVENLWIFGWALVGAGFSWSYRYHRSRPSRYFLSQLPLGFLWILTTGVGLVLAFWLVLLAGWWIPVVPALFTLVGSALAITGYNARTAEQLRWVFGRYLADEVVMSLLEQPEGLRLGGEKRRITILMSDLRGFSAFSERLPAEKSMLVINRYLETMTTVIQDYSGSINEIIGDGIMVMFGAPVVQENAAERAIACAIGMQLALAAMNVENQKLGLPQLEMGIGINTGEVLVGNVGSEKRAKFTALGSSVNLASRVESYTVGGQILITKETLMDVGSIVRIDQQFQIQPKGIQEPVWVYEVGGIGGTFNLSLPKQDDSFISLKQAIPILYLVLVGKMTEGTVFQGELVKLSAIGAELRTSHSLELLVNLKLNLVMENKKVAGLGDIYAKVIQRSESEGYLIRFTAIPPEVAALLRYLQELLQ